MLLSLPAELRVNIYRYAIEIECKVDFNIYRSTDGTYECWYLRTTEPAVAPGVKSKRRPRGRPVFHVKQNSIFALLRTCKAAYMEAKNFKPEVRLHIEHKGDLDHPDKSYQFELLNSFAETIEWSPAPSMKKLLASVRTITIGTKVVEDFLESFCCHDEDIKDGWNQAWFQLNDRWFFRNLERVVIFDDGRFGYGPHDMVSGDDVPDDSDERVDHYRYQVRLARLYLTQYDEWLTAIDPAETGLCKNVGGPARKFDICYQAFVYDYMWVFIEIFAGDNDVGGSRYDKVQGPRTAIENGAIDSLEWDIEHD